MRLQLKSPSERRERQQLLRESAKTREPDEAGRIALRQAFLAHEKSWSDRRETEKAEDRQKIEARRWRLQNFRVFLCVLVPQY